MQNPPIVRPAIGAIVALGLVGTAAELLLLEHYDSGWQLVPLILVAIAIPALAWHGLSGTTASRRALQVTMTLFVIAGILGVWLHYRGASEFQLEMDGSQHGPALWWKALRAKAPPVLAPGLMMQLGFLGLVYAYRKESQ